MPMLPKEKDKDPEPDERDENNPRKRLCST